MPLAMMIQVKCALKDNCLMDKYRYSYLLVTFAVDSNGNRSNSQQSDNTSLMSRSTLVVVHNVEEQSKDIKLDPLYVRIHEIPEFLPILENLSRRFPWSKPDKRELTEKLDAQAVIRMGHLYNGFLRKHTTIIVKNQMRLIKKIKQVDEALNKMLKSFTVRQKRCAYDAKKFEQVPDLSRNLSKCQKTLTEALKTAEYLNDLLPEEDRLESFIWCEEDESSCFNLNVKEEKPVSVDRWD